MQNFKWRMILCLLFLTLQVLSLARCGAGVVRCKDFDLGLNTFNSAYNEKKYAEILLCYRQLFIKGNVFIGERGIFGAEVFLRYR